MTAQELEQLAERLVPIITGKLATQPRRDNPYSVKEVAHILQMTKHHVYGLIKAGILPRVPGLRRVLVPAKAIQKMID